MLDETLLDAPEALALADRRDLLRGAAEAGARVRTAARHAAEAGIAELRPEGRPRTVLVAGRRLGIARAMPRPLSDPRSSDRLSAADRRHRA
ncbi:hypothetical protein ABZ990_27715, partial [Streptomyces sp. NPDC046203]